MNYFLIVRYRFISLNYKVEVYEVQKLFLYLLHKESTLSWIVSSIDNAKCADWRIEHVSYFNYLEKKYISFWFKFENLIQNLTFFYLVHIDYLLVR